jgi:hypothetical protein
MTTTRPRPRNHVTTLFAAALHGNVIAEHELRELAMNDDHAAEALCALVHVDPPDHTGSAPAAEIAVTDQVVAAVLEAMTRGRAASAEA